jgi:hypothetical protein
MGHDVSTTGNHKLDVSNIESLAKNLSKRFKAIIEYGYYHQYWFDVDEKKVRLINIIIISVISVVRLHKIIKI